MFPDFNEFDNGHAEMHARVVAAARAQQAKIEAEANQPWYTSAPVRSAVKLGVVVAVVMTVAHVYNNWD